MARKIATAILLTQEQMDGLGLLKKKTHISKAELVRIAIDEFLAKQDLGVKKDA